MAQFTIVLQVRVLVQITPCHIVTDNGNSHALANVIIIVNGSKTALLAVYFRVQKSVLREESLLLKYKF